MCNEYNCRFSITAFNTLAPSVCVHMGISPDGEELVALSSAWLLKATITACSGGFLYNQDVGRMKKNFTSLNLRV